MMEVEVGESALRTLRLTPDLDVDGKAGKTKIEAPRAVLS